MLDTPILYIVFNRLDTVQKTFPIIAKQKPKFLFIAADGPRQERENEDKQCEDVRNWILSHIDWECHIEKLFGETNLGCKYGVAKAIKWFFSKVESGIVLEDDIFASDSFFIYCSKALEKYRNNKNIGFISGCSFPKFISNTTQDYFLSTISGVWGWASWSDRINGYNPDLSSKMNKNNCYTFISKRAQKYIVENSFKAAVAKKGTWDYQMTDYLASNSMYTLFPKKNLVLNVGFTDNSTHTIKKPEWYTEEKFEYEIVLPNNPILDRKYALLYEKTNIPIGMDYIKHKLIKFTILYKLYKKVVK